MWVLCVRMLPPLSYRLGFFTRYASCRPGRSIYLRDTTSLSVSAICTFLYRTFSFPCEDFLPYHILSLASLLRSWGHLVHPKHNYLTVPNFLAGVSTVPHNLT